MTKGQVKGYLVQATFILAVIAVANRVSVIKNNVYPK